jgi:U3 small nucleolar RNA-associated protein 14
LSREASEKHSREVKRLAALASRRDAKLKHVLINEKVDQKAMKYQVATLPYPFTSQEAYEKSLMTPIGKEWNTTLSFQENVRPKVITKAGEIIDPIKYNPKVGAAGKKKEGGKKEPKKISGGAPAAGQKRKR